jgi:hypothetical protein
LETIAVYWEPVIKTYGFMEKTDLSLFRLSCPVDRMADWGQRMQEWGAVGDGFIMVVGSGQNGQTLQFNLLFEQRGVDRYGGLLEKWLKEEPRMSLQVETPVELIYFHGPHYGDRYGIASAALDALAVQAVPVLAMACTGASVYLILPEGKAGPAREGLGRAFVTPESGKKESAS